MREIPGREEVREREGEKHSRVHHGVLQPTWRESGALEMASTL